MNNGKLRLGERFRHTKVYTPGMNKRLPKRLNWEQIEARPPKEGRGVVKGTSKRIVVVKSPDPKVFEQAIFIVREDFIGKRGRANALKEAQQVADDYIKSAVNAPKHFLSDMSLLGWISAGLAATGIIALSLYLIFL